MNLEKGHFRWSNMIKGIRSGEIEDMLTETKE